MMKTLIGGRNPARMLGARMIWPLAITALCLWLLPARLDGFDWAELARAFGGVSAAQWIAAVGAAALSYWALGRYDLVLHRQFATGIADRDAQQTGMAAIAVSQVLGLGMVFGTVVRWKRLPALGPIRAAALTAAVSASFLTAWLILVALSVLLLAPGLLPLPLVLAPLSLLVILPLMSLTMPVLRLGRLRLALPRLPVLAAILGYALLDTLAAAVCLHLFLPSGLPFASLLPAFLIALGAGIYAGTPGGVGPFELTLLTLLPQMAEPDLMAAVLAFRLVYYALPAGIAAGWMLCTRSPLAGAADTGRPVPEALILSAAQAEAGLARQNGAQLLRSGPAAGQVLRSPHCAVLHLDPLSGDIDALAPALRRMARRESRLPLAYKVGARSALRLRQAGWHVVHVADEALIDPARFSLEGACHRQLRRKLRHAEEAGVRVARMTDLPMGHLASLDAAWQARHGTAHGFSMGRFSAQALADQAVFGAWQDGRLIAFASFHRNAQQYCLDLMRHGDDLPDGTMQALIVAAVATAARDGVSSLSLAALPAFALTTRMDRLRRLAGRPVRAAGLTRFKMAFAPRLQPRYIAAPSRAALMLGAADLVLTIRDPDRAVPAAATALPIAERVAI